MVIKKYFLFLHVMLHFIPCKLVFAQNYSNRATPEKIIQQFRVSQPGIYSGQNQEDPYYIHREPHRDYPDYQLYILCPRLKKEKAEGYWGFNNMDVYNQRTHAYIDHNGFHHIVDAKGIDCIHIIKNAWVKIDPTAYPIFDLDEAHASLSLTTQLAISMIPATYLGRAVFAASSVGFETAGVGMSTAYGFSIGSDALAFGISILPTAGTDLLSFLLIEKVNQLITTASNELKRNAVQRLSYFYLASGANFTNEKYIVGDGIENSQFSSNEEVTLGEDVRIVDVASKLYCYFGSADCLMFQKKYLHKKTMHDMLDECENDVCQLPFVKVWYDHKQASDDLPSMDPKLQKRISTGLGLGPYIWYD